MKKLLLTCFVMFVAIFARAASVTATLTTAPCNHNGVLTATLSGFSGSVTVNYYMYSGSITHTGITAGTDALTGYSGAYVVIVATDASSNTASVSFSGAPPFNYQNSYTNAVCPGLGSATANVSGGTPPYTYQWYTVPGNVNVSTSNPASLPAGQYGVKITDANGCVYGSADQSDSLQIGSISSIVCSVATTTAACLNGTATVSTPTGGTAPYSYSWSTGATTSSITGLTMGSYSVAVTDAIGCTQFANGYVSQSININANTTPTPATCLQNNGAIISFGSGGTLPYSYLWSNGATTQSQSGITPGYYSVKVTDANGCIGFGGGNVGTTTPITATVAATSSACTSATGTASLTISGGTIPYSIQWFTSPAQTTATATALAPGNYSFKITDNVGCVRTGTVNVAQVNIIAPNVSVTNASCTTANGSLSSAPAGGTAPYTYLWNTGGTASSINSLLAGSYSLTVTDAIGCSKTVYPVVKSTSPVNIGLSATNASCIFTSNGAITATAFGGTAPYSYLWSNGGTTAAITGLLYTSGNHYTVVATDANGCTAEKSTSIGYNAANNSCYCTIKGTVYNDANGNCIKDAGEQGIPNIQMHCSGIGYAYTDASGAYSFLVPTGTYTVSETVQTLYPLSGCQSNNVSISLVAASGCMTAINFANSVATIHDMHLSTWNHSYYPVPGFSYSQMSILYNAGTVTETSVPVRYATDGQLFAPTFIPGSLFSGSSNYYTATYSTLAPGSSQVFYANYTVPTNIPINTSLVFKDTTVHTLPISNWLTDYTPWDNLNYVNETVVGSFDPNDKEVKPKGQTSKGYIDVQDSVLEYKIHFQNVGNYKAQNVFILDSLDTDLDWTTMRPIYQSHPCKVTITDNGVIRFAFDNINLPAQVNDDFGSNGMVVYTIKTKKNLPDGTEFKNTAAIHFDFNEPVITNTTLNTLKKGVFVETLPVKNNGFELYPNPATNTCFAMLNNNAAGNGMIKIMEMNGRVASMQAVTFQKGKQQIAIDVSNLGSGVYFVSLNSLNGAQTQKLVIIR
jgi:hypothetical protein